jgi:thiamine biosynthesis lipoprotein
MLNSVAGGLTLTHPRAKSKGARRASVALAITIPTLLIMQNPGSSEERASEPTYQSEIFAMGTRIAQRVTGANGQAAIDEVAAKMKSLEEMMTFWLPSGNVHQINKNAGIRNVELDPATIKVIRKSLQVAELSGGAFDITVGPLVRLWASKVPQREVPSAEELRKVLPLINYKDVHVDERTGGLKRAGQMVDLGGIAKGYAGDVAIDIYKKHGIRSAFVNLGGNVIALGSKPDGSPWTIGIRNPRPGEGAPPGEQVLGFIAVTDKAVTTSGDDQRYFEKDGQRYHHIVDPRTGYPARSGLMSVTLVTPSSFDADAFDTAVFILGLEKGKELVRKLGNMDAIFVTTDKKIHVTDGLKAAFTFHDESNEYEYVK